MKTAAQQLLDWIENNPNTISKILAEQGGSDNPDDVEQYLTVLVEQLTMINIVMDG